MKNFYATHEIQWESNVPHQNGILVEGPWPPYSYVRGKGVHEQGKSVILACPLFFRKPCYKPVRKVTLMMWMLC